MHYMPDHDLEDIVDLTPTNMPDPTIESDDTLNMTPAYLPISMPNSMSPRHYSSRQASAPHPPRRVAESVIPRRAMKRISKAVLIQLTILALLSGTGFWVVHNIVPARLSQRAAILQDLCATGGENHMICGPVHAEHSELVNTKGKPVHLAGVNWPGFETPTFAPAGLTVRNYQDMLNQMVKCGFNTLRLPYSNQLFDPASVPTGISYTLNPDLRGLRGLALMDKIVAGAQKAGLRIILDQHRPDAYAQSDLWYTPQVPESRWLHDWVMLAQHYRDSPAIIGADLHNEPHDSATWGDGNLATDWRLAAERAGNAILAVNPNWLIIVEGIQTYHGDSYWWGGNLEGARQYPVRLSHPQQLVYSAHDYGPDVWEQTWFQAPTFPKNLPDIWQKYWGYLQTEHIAPVYVGEFGGSMQHSAEAAWQTTLVSYLSQNRMSYTYWCWNPDSGDTGGILEKDWKTVDQARLDVLRSYQWPLLAQPGF
jgi:endoglucanase